MSIVNFRVAIIQTIIFLYQGILKFYALAKSGVANSTNLHW